MGRWVAKVIPLTDGRFEGSVVDSETGKSGGLGSRTATAKEAAADAIDNAEWMNDNNVKPLPGRG